MMYAVKVPFENSFLYVTEYGHSVGNLKPVLFNTLEEAHEHALFWGPNAIVVDFNSGDKQDLPGV